MSVGSQRCTAWPLHPSFWLLAPRWELPSWFLPPYSPLCCTQAGIWDAKLVHVWWNWEHSRGLHVQYYNNNNNKAFKSQTSWGRLELKPNRSNQGSGTWIAVFQALLSKTKSLGIFHPFKSPFIASTQVNFGLPLPLFTLLSWLRFHYAPVPLGVSVAHIQTISTGVGQAFLQLVLPLI